MLKGNGDKNATSSTGYETDRYIYARAAGEVMAGNPELAHEFLGKMARLPMPSDRSL